MPRPLARSRSSLALDNLRAFVILVVLAFHSSLAYLQWMPVKAANFDSPPYDWRAFPIVDPHRFFGLDLLCAWQDVYLMSLMFFLSGLFVWPSLKRKGNWSYLRDRVFRLGVPFAFGIVILIPIAIYPAYALTAVDPSAAAYGKALLALPFWPNGPLWFLWQLLALNIIAVVVQGLAPGAIRALGRWSAAAGAHPFRYFAVAAVVSAAAYVPMALVFTPWAWSDWGILAVQFSRPLLYAVYFFAGIGLGIAGIDRGIMAADGALARHWAIWLAAALASLFLWMGLTGLTLHAGASPMISVAAELAYALACTAGCFFVIGASLRFAVGRSRILNSVAVNAYGLYLVHYIFVVWLQYALLDAPLFAVVKAAIVFAGTLVLSWTTIVAVQHVPLGELIGSVRRAVAGLPGSLERATPPQLRESSLLANHDSFPGCDAARSGASLVRDRTKL